MNDQTRAMHATLILAALRSKAEKGEDEPGELRRYVMALTGNLDLPAIKRPA